MVSPSRRSRWPLIIALALLLGQLIPFPSIGGTSQTRVDDDFDTGTYDASSWSDLRGFEVSNTYCRANSDPYALTFTGAGPRRAETVPLDLEDGGRIRFALRLGNGGDNCDTVEELEGVSLEYSVDGGTSWQQIRYFEPGTHGWWTVVEEAVPLAAQTGATMIRWQQPTHSGAVSDLWAIDDVLVEATNILPPSTPQWVDASEGPSTGQIRVTWGAPSLDGGAPISGYRIYRLDGLTGEGEPQLVAERPAFPRSWDDSQLPTQEYFRYAVSALNAAGEGPRSGMDWARPKQDVASFTVGPSLNTTVAWVGDPVKVTATYQATTSECASGCPIPTEWRIWLSTDPSTASIWANENYEDNGTNVHPGDASTQSYQVSTEVQAPTWAAGTEIYVILCARPRADVWNQACKTAVFDIEGPQPGSLAGPWLSLDRTLVWPGEEVTAHLSYSVFQQRCRETGTCPVENAWQIQFPFGTTRTGGNTHPAHGETLTYDQNELWTPGLVSPGTYTVSGLANDEVGTNYDGSDTASIQIRPPETHAFQPDPFVVVPEYTFGGNVRADFNYQVFAQQCAGVLICPIDNLWHVRLGDVEENGEGFSSVEGSLLGSGTNEHPAHGESINYQESENVDVSGALPGSYWVKAAARGTVSSQPWSVASREVVIMSFDDGDGDGVPDSIEPELCGRDVEKFLLDTLGGIAGSCASDSDYEPPTEVVSFEIPTQVAIAQVDADDDDFPPYVDIYHTRFTFDPTNPVGFTDPEPGTVRRETIDPDDHDPNTPVISNFCVPTPVPSAIPTVVDNDGDGFPGEVQVHRSQICFDRRFPDDPVSIVPAADYVLLSDGEVDPDDNDPNNPVTSTVTVEDILVWANFTKDEDRDGVPGYIEYTYATITIDRTNASNLTITNRTELQELDPDDGDRNSPVPWAAIDADGDWVPDAAESYVCFVEDGNDDIDGYCEGNNYHPPSWYSRLLVDPGDL